MVEDMAEFAIPGIDGIGVHYLGKRGKSRRFLAISYGFTAGLKTWHDSLAALIGTTVTITNDQGHTFANHFIQSVGEVKQQNNYHLGLYDQRWEIEVVAKAVA